MTAPFSSLSGDTAEAEDVRPPAGGGMAARIRGFDWSKTPLGPMKNWPQNLRTIVDLMLGSDVVMAAQWGEQGILLFNDAYSRLIGARAAIALGHPVFHVLPELRPILEPQFVEVRAGRMVRAPDHSYPFVRTDVLENTWFDISCSPVRGDDGEVSGILTILTEATGRVLAERYRDDVRAALRDSEERQRFLLKLSDLVRPLTAPADIAGEAASLFGEWFAMSRVFYAEIAGSCMKVDRDYVRGVSSLAGEHSLKDFGDLLTAYRTEATVTVNDVETDPRLGEEARAGLRARQVAAFVDVVLFKEERCVGVLAVQSATPRVWTAAEEIFFREIGERLKLAIERARGEETLRASEGRYRDLVEHATDGIFVAGPDGRYLDVNRAGCAMLGMTRDEVLKLSVPDVLVPEEHDRIQPEVASFADGEVHLSEWRFRRKDGSTFIGEIAGRQLPDGRLQGVVRDITERRRTEERLRESEARLRKELAAARSLQMVSSLLIREDNIEALYSRIVDAAAAVMSSNAASIQIVAEGGGSLRLLAWKGFSPEAAAFWKTVTLESESSCGEALREGKRIVVSDIESCAFMAESDDLKFYRLCNIGAVQSTPLVSRTGRPLGMISTHWREPHEPSEDELRLFDVLARQAADLIERGLSEEALRNSEERFQLATEAGEVGFWDVDPVGGRLFWPARVKAMFGISGDVPVSMADFYAGLHPEDRQRTSAAFAMAIDPGKRALYDVEYRTVGKEDKVTRWVAARGRGIFDENGTCVRVIGTAIDITARKQADEHRELLINELNHRVKNTLVTVQSFAGQTLRNTERSADARAMFESRLTALARAHDVLTQESWKGAGLRELVNRALDPFRTPQRKLIAEGPEARLAPKQALALSMALHELATNAVKYGALSGADGKVQVTWTVAASNGSGEFDLTWREQDGPPVSPPKRKGFGSRLIERNLSRELGGEARIEYRPDGIVANVKAPLEWGGIP